MRCCAMLCCVLQMLRDIIRGLSLLDDNGFELAAVLKAYVLSQLMALQLQQSAVPPAQVGFKGDAPHWLLHANHYMQTMGYYMQTMTCAVMGIWIPYRRM